MTETAETKTGLSVVKGRGRGVAPLPEDDLNDVYLANDDSAYIDIGMITGIRRLSRSQIPMLHVRLMHKLWLLLISFQARGG